MEDFPKSECHVRVKCDEKPPEIAIKTDQLHQRMCERKKKIEKNAVHTYYCSKFQTSKGITTVPTCVL